MVPEAVGSETIVAPPRESYKVIVVDELDFLQDVAENILTPATAANEKIIILLFIMF